MLEATFFVALRVADRLPQVVSGDEREALSEECIMFTNSHEVLPSMMGPCLVTGARCVSSAMRKVRSFSYT